MNKDDMIYDLLKKIDKKIDDHIGNTGLHGKGLSVKEWGIIAGIITTVCTTAVTIATIVMNGKGV